MTETRFHAMPDGRRIAFRFLPGAGPALVFLPGYMSDMAGSKATAVLDWAGQRTLLTHGDLLCTDDVAYQQFRREVRTDAWQRAVLARPLAERQVMAQQMRAQSMAAQAQGVVYTDIDAPLAVEWLTAADARTLIHGHIHRPGDHVLGHDAQGQPLTQVVLSDWHIAGNDHRAQVLRLSSDSQLERIDLGPM